MDRIIRNLRLAQLFQLGHSALIHIPHTEGYLLGMELLSGANQGFQYIKAGELYLHHMLSGNRYLSGHKCMPLATNMSASPYRDRDSGVPNT